MRMLFLVKTQEWDFPLIKTYTEEIYAINKYLNKRYYKINGFKGEDFIQDLHSEFQTREFCIFDFRKYIQAYETVNSEKIND